VFLSLHFSFDTTDFMSVVFEFEPTPAYPRFPRARRAHTYGVFMKITLRTHTLRVVLTEILAIDF
jgi:hypothetical protein